MLRLYSLLLLCAGAWSGVSVQAEDWTLEYKLKAVCLYNFSKFVEWPSDAFPNESAPLVVGILGTDPFGPDFDQALRNKLANGRKIEIKRFAQVQDVSACHMLFVAASETAHLSDAMEKVKDKSVMLVGDVPDFAKNGGTVRFFLEDNKIRFEINLEAAKRSRLKINSQLLSLAKSN